MLKLVVLIHYEVKFQIHFGFDYRSNCCEKIIEMLILNVLILSLELLEIMRTNFDVITRVHLN